MAAPVEGSKDATPTTHAHNRAVLDALPFSALLDDFTLRFEVVEPKREA